MSFLSYIAAWLMAPPDPANRTAERMAAQVAALMASPEIADRMRAEVIVRRMVYECTDGGLGSGDYDPAYVTGVVRAMAAHGDDLMLPHLQRLAEAAPRRAEWAGVQSAARHALPRLHARIEQMERREHDATLLRPAGAPDASLLRPAEREREDALLRPMEGSDELA